MRRDIVVVGASAGGVPALERLVAGLREPLHASVFVVLHVSSQSGSALPQILHRAGPLPAAHAVDGEPIEPGRIYVSPPNAHLLLEFGRVRLGLGPPENGHRPAVDALFRSAAYVYRRRVMGVVLSGTLDDGTAGLWAIKRRGGLAVVQDPAEALHPGMPQSAIDNVQVDHVLGVADIGAFVLQSAHELLSEAPAMAENDERLGREVAVAIDPTDANRLEQPYGPDAKPAALSCPSCRGTLWEIQEGKVVRYRCQVGHAFSSAALLAAQNRGLEDALWAACRTLEENATLARRLSARAEASGNHLARAKFDAKAQSASERAALIRRALLLTTSALESGGDGLSEVDLLHTLDPSHAAPQAQPAPTPRPKAPPPGPGGGASGPDEAE
ncbi:MAG TPA: chemotaxis protein CheB [Polyangiaceae bacterium]|nr:chemotaxis protein CheB [Polyangiaceae bacterium]